MYALRVKYVCLHFPHSACIRSSITHSYGSERKVLVCFLEKEERNIIFISPSSLSRASDVSVFDCMSLNFNLVLGRCKPKYEAYLVNRVINRVIQYFQIKLYDKFLKKNCINNVSHFSIYILYII